MTQHAGQVVMIPLPPRQLLSCPCGKPFTPSRHVPNRIHVGTFKRRGHPVKYAASCAACGNGGLYCEDEQKAFDSWNELVATLTLEAAEAEGSA
jgi:hypothetical protein